MMQEGIEAQRVLAGHDPIDHHPVGGCDRHNVLLVSDEVICAWGRLGHYFGCERYG